MAKSKKNTNTNTNKEAPKKVAPSISVDKENIIEKSEMCKVTYVDDLIYINFKGFGLITKNEKGYKDPQIEVFYSGEFGKPDFKFRI